MVDSLGHRDLFRSHIAERADHPVVGGAARRDLGPQERGQAEIDEPHPSTRVHQHVLRLDVAVDYPGLMGVLQGLGDLRHEVEGIALGERTLFPSRRCRKLAPSTYSITRQ